MSNQIENTYLNVRMSIRLADESQILAKDSQMLIHKGDVQNYKHQLIRMY